VAHLGGQGRLPRTRLLPIDSIGKKAKPVPLAASSSGGTRTVEDRPGAQDLGQESGGRGREPHASPTRRPAMSSARRRFLINWSMVHITRPSVSCLS